MHWKCKEVSEVEAEDGEIRTKRVLKVTRVNWPGKRPVENPNQGAMFTVVSDENGTRTETEGDDKTAGDESGVESPAFSDAEGGADDAD